MFSSIVNLSFSSLKHFIIICCEKFFKKSIILLEKPFENIIFKIIQVILSNTEIL